VPGLLVIAVLAVVGIVAFGGVLTLFVWRVAADVRQREREGAARETRVNPVRELFRAGFAGPTIAFWVASFMGLLLVYGLNTWLPEIMRLAGYQLTQALYQLLVTARNQHWLPEIERLANGSGNSLVVVGALHLVGDGGLLELLRKDGYVATQLN